MESPAPPRLSPPAGAPDTVDMGRVSDPSAELERLRARVAELERRLEASSPILDALGTSEARLHKLLEQASDAIVITDPEGRIADMNPAALRLLGYSATQVQKLSVLDLVDPDDLDTHPADVERVRAGGPVVRERLLLHRDGSRIPVETTTYGMDDGWALAIARDIRERLAHEEQLSEVQERMNLALRSARIATWSWDLGTKRLHWDDFVGPLLGLPSGSPGDVRQFFACVHAEDRSQVEGTVAHAVRKGTAYDVEFRVIWPSGAVHVLAARGEVSLDARGRPERMAGACWDITDRREAEAQARRLADYDPLTGLANRRFFLERLEDAIASGRRAGARLAVLFLDLDGFKEVNETLGHGSGDRLLQSVAERLHAVIRLRDVVGRRAWSEEPASLSRFGGDEFTILLRGIADDVDAGSVAARLAGALSRPFDVDGHAVHASASVGVALFPNDGADAATLLRSAGSAAYHAKRRGRGGYAFYTRAMNARASRRLEIRALLRKALDEGDFCLRYQPVLDARSKRVVGAEALLRLLDPDGHTLGPAEFISVAEESGLIVPIGNWVLRTACLALREWRREGLDALRVSVNVSSHQLHDGDLLAQVRGALEAGRLPAERLVLELTESAVMQDDATTNRTLRALHAMGVRLSLDDFGTGYSSLSRLRRLPLRHIKIDRSFVRDVARDPGDASLTAAIIGMAHELGLHVVAEGVEAQEQADFLVAHGCDDLQGFLYSPPIPDEQLRIYARKQGVAVVPRRAAGG